MAEVVEEVAVVEEVVVEVVAAVEEVVAVEDWLVESRLPRRDRKGANLQRVE